MQYITLLLSSTPPPATTSPIKVRVEYSCGSVEYTTACSTADTTLPSKRQDSVIEPAVLDDVSGDESDDMNLEVDEGGTYGEGENSNGLGVGFEYDDKYMS